MLHATFRAVGLAASGALLLYGGPVSAATAISGSVDAAVSASIGYGPFVTTADQNTDAAAGLPASLSAQAHTVAEYNVDTVVVDVSNAAVWQTANQGQFVFDASWALSLSQLSSENETAGFGFHPLHTGDWTYTFTAARNGEIVFDYDVVSTGQTLGIGGWGVSWRRQGVAGTNGHMLTQNNLVDDQFARVQGSHSVALLEGATYTFWLTNHGAIGIGGGVGARSAATSGTIGWHIAEVPEPTTWALMILGFGLAGAALRSRRCAAA
ncbi:MAG: PEP-CTERM sorting domain-containing protein [Phenylobacterium sp.]|uniref:PEPxxWA-CTERM sorting domain-containing protein n=1 Tax=Phenylobacterium sp. TaxID=1871053 RepID=UPI001A303316|nr:PEPxxWA-CTERM sorting domain-containing protein [Phenylobacterium sp.]MBJ7413049.1 PEP-CTERM sorting domain-containing protein [Phenylobacterium sp.]